MSRDIKFRGIADKPGGGIEIVYGDLTHDQEGRTAYFDSHPYRISWYEGTAYCNKPIRKGTAMQYTGLKDKNGKEIYEGDLLSSDHITHAHNPPEVVEFETKPKMGDYSESYGYTFMHSANQLEVIGNIYEEKDLL